MKKYTQAEFDAFEIIGGKRQCPTGDYRDIDIFPAYCSFGEWCSFGERCSFGEHCSFGEWCQIEDGKEMNSFLKFEGFGSEKRCTYFFLLTDNSIYVRCGCFAGTIDEFRIRVEKTHGSSFYAEGYLKMAELAEWQLNNERSNL